MRGDANGKGLFRKTTYSFADTISNAKSISFFIKKKKKKNKTKPLELHVWYTNPHACSYGLFLTAQTITFFFLRKILNKLESNMHSNSLLLIDNVLFSLLRIYVSLTILKRVSTL